MDDNDLISEENLAAAAAYHLDAARLSGFDRVLTDTAALERNSLLTGKARDSYVDGLLIDRAAALTKLRDHHVLTYSDRFDEKPWYHAKMLNEIAKQLTEGWWTLKVPTMHEGFCQAPDAPGTSGQIETSSLARGTVGFGGTPTNERGVGPHEEQYWVCNWQCTVVFPPAPKDGILSYRFGVDCSATPYFASALSGGIYAWVRTGATGNASLPLANWRDFWPVDVTLPLAPGQSKFLGRDVPIAGHLTVKKDARAALGLIFGMVVGLASGSVHFLQTDCSFVTHKAMPYTLPADLGRIEYRFDDILLWKSAGDYISLELKHFP